MKRTHWIYSFIILILSNCSGFLDIKPKEVLTSDLALENIADYEKALLGAYASLRGGNYYGQDLLILPEIIADNLQVTNQNRGSYIFHHSWDYTANDDPGIWTSLYALIHRVNTVIGTIDEVAEQTTGQRNRIKGQALALRALAHFDLLRVYGQNYNRNSSSLGVAVIKQVLSPNATPARNTVKEVYDQIYDDLNNAKQLLGNVDIAVPQPHFINQLAVSAIFARVALYAEDWQQAIANASEVISSKSLSNQTDFKKMWADQNFIGETLFSVPFSAAEGGAIGLLMYDPNFETAEFKPSENLTGSYDAVNDIRFQAYYLTQSDKPTIPFPTVQQKYPTNGTSIFSDVRVLRVGEMYLIRAEANLRGNVDANAALADYNALRNARITGNTNEINTVGLLDKIMIERRREMALEGHRWFDIRRDMARTNQGVVRGADCLPPATRCNLAANNFRFVFPIPQSEILANPAMIQNTGYSN